MNSRSLPLVVSITAPLGLAACGQEATPALPAVATADLIHITLVPFTHPEGGIKDARAYGLAGLHHPPCHRAQQHGR